MYSAESWFSWASQRVRIVSRIYYFSTLRLIKLWLGFKLFAKLAPRRITSTTVVYNRSRVSMVFARRVQCCSCFFIRTLQYAAVRRRRRHVLSRYSEIKKHKRKKKTKQNKTLLALCTTRSEKKKKVNIHRNALC